jgi:phenylalanyl-tRNA synthetase alpha chain
MSDPVLRNPERRLAAAMRGAPERAWDVAAILDACGWSDQAVATGAAVGLVEHGLAEQAEQHKETVSLGPAGRDALERGLLEARLVDWIASTDEPTMAALQGDFDRSEAGPGVGLLKALNVTVQGGTLVAEDLAATKATIEQRSAFLAALPAPLESLDAAMLEHFRRRRDLVVVEASTERSWTATAAAIGLSDEALVERDMVGEITPDLLQQGLDWDTVEVRRFDVTLPAAMPTMGRTHPMQALIERIRTIFLEMGFSELVDDYVQTAGWNMDALFIPQDHPAREMQDTFYLDEPASLDIDHDHLAAWKNIHEHGGETGSRGWGGTFSEDIARRGLLRTHTTVNTVQYLARHPNTPCRVFSVDRVFRKEAIDRTHLPEFHQIEGIIMEEGANLPMLVTTLKTFYAKMGYPEVRVRPAYFPYTEPSLEVEVRWRGKWLELGGAGIFRPEVTEPLGCMSPVVAWGMGLERLAMLVLGLDDIRQLYISDLAWLQSQPVL